MTPTGIPFPESSSTAASLLSGVEARGSIRRCRFGSKLVIEKLTAAAPWAANSASRSASRVTR